VQSLKPRSVRLDYSSDPLITDGAFQHVTMGRIALAASAVEEAAGSPQDIEGVIAADNALYIVQTRPQV
jgi:alpha-glucan,water dikinase